MAISRWILFRVRTVPDKICGENQNTFYVITSLLLHGKNGYVNAPQYYFTLLLWFNNAFSSQDNMVLNHRMTSERWIRKKNWEKPNVAWFMLQSRLLRVAIEEHMIRVRENGLRQEPGTSERRIKLSSQSARMKFKSRLYMKAFTLWTS